MLSSGSGEITALIPAAGLGTRMIPATKEIPKEMLPVPDRGGQTVFKPFIQLIFEHLYEAGIRVFVIVVGRGKRILQDHFVADWSFYEYLRGRGKHREAAELERFYGMLEDSTIVWVDQPMPRGLGDAVERGLAAVATRKVLIHLGDILLYHPAANHVRELLEAQEKCPRCRGVISLQPVPNPRSYGVAAPGSQECDFSAATVERIVMVEDLVEKPEKPPSNLAIAGVYLLETPALREALARSGVNPRTGEKELTDALRHLARGDPGLCGVVARNTRYLDIGRPERYLEALRSLSGDST